MGKRGSQCFQGLYQRRYLERNSDGSELSRQRLSSSGSEVSSTLF